MCDCKRFSGNPVPATVVKRDPVYAKAMSDCWNYGSCATPVPTLSTPAKEGDCGSNLKSTVAWDTLDIGAEVDVGDDASNVSEFPSSPDLMVREEQQKCKDIIEQSNGKQKTMAGEEVGVGTMAEVYVEVKQKRRLLFKDVEIIRFRRGGKSRKDEYFKCSVCPFKLPIPKLTRREAEVTSELSPYMKMKVHIQKEHKGKPCCVKKRARPQYTCGYCEITFANLASLKNHNKTKVHPEFLTCDICERPVKGGHFNLLQHKFSHKNDEERKKSLLDNERGSYNAFHSSKLISVYMHKKKKKEKNVKSSGKSGEAGLSLSTSSSPAA